VDNDQAGEWAASVGPGDVRRAKRFGRMLCQR
jgi:hypothetical protein